jgi:hypothetical protein
LALSSFQEKNWRRKLQRSAGQAPEPEAWVPLLTAVRCLFYLILFIYKIESSRF